MCNNTKKNTQQQQNTRKADNTIKSPLHPDTKIPEWMQKRKCICICELRVKIIVLGMHWICIH